MPLISRKVLTLGSLLKRAYQSLASASALALATSAPPSCLVASNAYGSLFLEFGNDETTPLYTAALYVSAIGYVKNIPPKRVADARLP